jgi:predicted HicB family RNase H-like nuclease
MSRRPAYLLRFPTGLREALKAEAKAQGRTLNAHIIFILTNRR